MFRTALLGVALALAICDPVAAQQPQLAPGQVLANDTATNPRPARAASVTAVLDRAFNSNQGSIVARDGTGWGSTRAPVLGLAGTAQGSIAFENATSGRVTFAPVLGALGSRTINIPAASGTLAVSASSPVNIDAAGNISLTATGTGSVVLNVRPTLTLQDSTLTIQDDADNTKQVQFQLSGISSGTTRVLTLPDGSTTLLGTSVAATVGNKTFSNSNIYTAKDNGFTLQDDVDATKQAVFQLSGISTGTTRTYTLPDATTTLLGIDNTATVTNKTINGSSNTLTVLAGSQLSGQVPIANGGTSQSTANAARQSSGLNIWGDAGTGHGDTNVTIGNSERMAYTNAAFTAPRTWTLPAANVTGAPYTVQVTDIQGGVTATNTLTIQRAGADTINGGTNVVIAAANGSYQCSSDGSTKWSCQSTGAASAGGVTSIACGNGLAGGTITTMGTCSLAAFTPQGRLTLASNTPYMIASQAAKSTIFYDCVAASGGYVPVYNGTSIQALAIPSCEYSMGLDSGVPRVASGSLYDIFGVNNSGSLALCIGPAWSSATTRGTGAGTTQLHFSTTVGLLTNQNSLTNCYGGAAGTTNFGSVAVDQGTYLGTFLASANGQTQFIYGAASSGGTAGAFNLWNAHNRVAVTSTVTDNGANYTYSSATIRQARASAGNQTSFVIGWQIEPVQFSYTGSESLSATAGAQSYICVGLDVTNACSRPGFYLRQPQATNAFEGGGSTAGSFSHSVVTLLGSHFIAALESNPVALGTSTFDLKSDSTLDVTVWY